MVRQAPISLEALKLKLISSSSKPTSSSDPLLTKDGIHYLLKALVYADNSFSTEIENVLVKAGALAIPELIKSLATSHINVRSTAAMALIRMGVDAEDAILQAYPKYSKKAVTRWVFEFIMQELGLKIPQRAVETDSPVIPLEMVG
jgi:hypothetical protein